MKNTQKKIHAKFLHGCEKTRDLAIFFMFIIVLGKPCGSGTASVSCTFSGSQFFILGLTLVHNLIIKKRHYDD